MQHLAHRFIALAPTLLLGAVTALAQPPLRDLSVEVRELDESSATAYTAGTSAARPLLVPQQQRVRNGGKVSVQLNQSIPMQWVQSVSSQNASLTTPGASASSQGGAVSQALTWMDAGQSIELQPRWSGGKEAVTVEIEVQATSVGERSGSELPTQSRSRVSTTVSVPLGQWVTIASSGASAPSGVVSSEAVNSSRRLLQLRVLAP